MPRPLTIASIGEPMIELAAPASGSFSYDRRYGGDTLNTAVYLARLLSPEAARIQYVTRLGDDPLSEWMIQGFRSEGIDCSLIARVKDRRPGLYIIDTDAKGERSFSYWRGEAPARQLFEDQDLARQLSAADAIYTSGITLAILGDRGPRAAHRSHAGPQGSRPHRSLRHELSRKAVALAGNGGRLDAPGDRSFDPCAPLVR